MRGEYSLEYTRTNCCYAGVDDSPRCTVTCKKPGTKEHRLRNFLCMKFKGRQNQMPEIEVRTVVLSGGEKELM